jgi:hypothetical protein
LWVCHECVLIVQNRWRCRRSGRSSTIPIATLGTVLVHCALGVFFERVEDDRAIVSHTSNGSRKRCGADISFQKWDTVELSHCEDWVMMEMTNDVISFRTVHATSMPLLRPCIGDMSTFSCFNQWPNCLCKRLFSIGTAATAAAFVECTGT